MDKITKQFFGVLTSVDEEARTVTHFITTADLDRTGDIVLAQGGQVDNYLSGGGVVLWAHEDDDAPIGQCLSLVMKEGGWEAVTYFHEHEEAEKLWQIVKRGGLRTWSIGFIPILVSFTGDIRVVETWELLEYSLVNIPANPKALSKGYRETGFKEFLDELKSLGTDEARQELSDIRMESATSTISIKLSEIESYKTYCEKHSLEFPENLKEALRSVTDSVHKILGNEDEAKELPVENQDQLGNTETENGDQPNNVASTESPVPEEIYKKISELTNMYKNGNSAVQNNFSGRTV